MRVAVLLGGSSAERDVSLRSGHRVVEAVRRLGHEATAIDAGEEFVSDLIESRPDQVFIALHGRPGEDGTVQGFLELLGIPYTGSGVLASALALNKIYAKRVWAEAGVQTPRFISASSSQWPTGAPRIIEEASRLGFPLVVKPACEGSTLGLEVVKAKDGLKSAVQGALRFDREVLLEEFIEGREITVGILGNDHPTALPTLEVVTERPIYDYEAKYTEGQSRHIIPARISPEGRKKAAEIAIEAHEALGCRGFSRVDLIVTAEEEQFVLEVNTIPGLTELSLFPDAARAAGIEFPQLVQRILELSREPARAG